MSFCGVTVTANKLANLPIGPMQAAAPPAGVLPIRSKDPNDLRAARGHARPCARRRSVPANVVTSSPSCAAPHTPWRKNRSADAEAPRVNPDQPPPRWGRKARPRS